MFLRRTKSHTSTPLSERTTKNISKSSCLLQCNYCKLRFTFSIMLFVMMVILVFRLFPDMGNSSTVKVNGVIRQGCQRAWKNSQTWLSGSRLGNKHVGLDLIEDLIINVYPNTSELKLKQTICHETSRFLQVNVSLATRAHEELKDFAFRLTYLAIHEHQHRHAREEARARMMQCELQDSNHVGNFDYECPNAQFIVSNLPNEGMGHSLRYGAVGSLLLGLGTDRVVLFLNSTPWTAASCDRHDLQCFFMPASPCVITKEELENAPILTSKEVNEMRSMGLVNDKFKQERVIQVNSPGVLNGNLQPPNVKQAILEIIRSLYNNSDLENNESAMDEMMDKISKSMGKWTLDHAAALYMMRPNQFYHEQISHRMNQIFPKDFNPQRAIGLPIRASDRCKTDGCLNFDQYMTIARIASEKSAERDGRLMHDSIILTTESSDILSARGNFTNNASWPVKFFINEADVGQNSGFPGDFGEQADDVMLSTIIALKMQLMAAITIANCCSGFHKLMGEFLSRGCGAAKANNFECLQENDNPEFCSCCQYSSNKKCQGQPISFSGSNSIFIE